MVFRTLRVFDEKICTRLPDVIAKVSEGGVTSGFDGRAGKEMCVIGFECGDGTSCCDLKPAEEMRGCQVESCLGEA